jgi:hypothetical protein
MDPSKKSNRSMDAPGVPWYCRGFGTTALLAPSAESDTSPTSSALGASSQRRVRLPEATQATLVFVLRSSQSLGEKIGRHVPRGQVHDRDLPFL